MGNPFSNKQILAAREKYFKFLKTCQNAAGEISLTPRTEISYYATCFWIFGLRLLKKNKIYEKNASSLSAGVRSSVRRKRRQCTEDNLRTKQYRQLLAFSLSALAILQKLDDDPLEELVLEQLPQSVEQELINFGCHLGAPQSGNQAMFLAIFLLHSKQHLGRDVSMQIEQWVSFHKKYINNRGFWGNSNGMTHLQFQNGYHQYEILEYLGVSSGKEDATAAAVAQMADAQGHFAPYPGGGGCFDYDAVFMLTPKGRLPDAAVGALLRTTASTLVSEQQADGGFCESLYVRPRSTANLLRTARHVLGALPNLSATMERGRYALALQCPLHDRIATHWSTYSRRWDESDLWDSWFRMLALARIECAMDPAAASRWGFIDYPGIGYHPALRRA